MTQLEANPTFQQDVAALETALPSSVVQEAENDPEALVDEVGVDGTLPAWVSAIPTPVEESLETLLAKPIKAVDDVEGYVEQLVKEPEISSVISVLMTAVPTSVQQSFETDPASFLENILTATTLPSWVTDIPAPLQSDLGSIVNEAFSIIDKDLEGGAATATAIAGATTTAAGASNPTTLASGYAQATGVSGVVGYNGTSGGSAGAPVAFTGAAAPMKTAAVGLAVLLVGAEAVLNI